jgi:hypothetical protein
LVLLRSACCSLTIDQVIPNDELRQRIDAWVAERKSSASASTAP